MCDGPLESYVLGTHEWRIEGDNVQCSAKGEAYTATLKLTGCREGEFSVKFVRKVSPARVLYSPIVRLTRGRRNTLASFVKNPITAGRT